MENILLVENDGPLVLSSNFWTLEPAKQGLFYLTTNAGCFRLLVPNQHKGAVREMRTAKEVVVRRGPYRPFNGHEAAEILFDDGSKDPFSMHLALEQLDRVPLDANTAGTWTFAVYTQLVGQKVKLELEKPCYYARVRSLPDLRPWTR